MPLGGTMMQFAAGGHVTMSLHLPGTSPLTACQPADPTVPLTPATATLEGDVQPGTLNRLHMTGVVPDIAVVGGRTATVTLDLFLRVSL